MPRAGFEPAILASERPQTHAPERATNGIVERHMNINITTLQPSGIRLRVDKYQCFGPSFFFRFQVSLKNQSTRRDILDDRNIHQHRCENLKSRIII